MGEYRSEEAPDYKGFNPANGFVEELKGFWKENSRCLFITAFPDEADLSEWIRLDMENALIDTGLSIACMDLCDRRNGYEKTDVLGEYDMIILGGGHVPTENAFFEEIGLREALRGWDGIVMGISAGSMNCAELVYAQPEMPGEAVSQDYCRFIKGLGLTDVNILPHYQAVKDDFVDGLRLMEDITYPDSAGHVFYAIPDGSYFLQTEERKELRGEAYRIAEGRIEKICEEGERFFITGIHLPNQSATSGNLRQAAYRLLFT